MHGKFGTAWFRRCLKTPFKDELKIVLTTNDNIQTVSKAKTYVLRIVYSSYAHVPVHACTFSDRLAAIIIPNEVQKYKRAIQRRIT